MKPMSHALGDTGQGKAMAVALDALIDEVVDRQSVVGTSVLVACDGTVVYQRFAGWADRERGQAVGPETIFRLASMTKPVISSAILALIEDGQLGLDEPVERYLPWFRPRWKGKEYPITLRQLLTHTSGLSCGFGESIAGHPYVAAGVSDGLDMNGGTLADNLRRLADVELYSRPGSEWRYSLSTDVLGAVIEEVRAAPLSEAIRQIVTEPLRMERTGFHPVDHHSLATAYVDSRQVDGTPAERMPDLCLYDREDGKQVRYAPNRAFDTTAYPSGGVGMVGNASDYLQFLEAIQQGRFPSARAASSMVTDQISTLGTDKPDTGFGFGFSVLRESEPDGRSKGTWAWGGLYGTTFWVDPHRNTTVIILTNTALEGMNGTFPARVTGIVCSAAERSKQTSSLNHVENGRI